jgi:4-diphosphocytidyl-2-C-methyl-D-erythritol kinase
MRAAPATIAGVIRLFAPAKINLSLEVIGKRDDGYHDVRTVLQAIDLADELTFEPADDLTLVVEPSRSVAVEGNLVLRAANALREAIGTKAGAAIALRKRIPVAAGLGGGSSDAAATLLGLRSLWAPDFPDGDIYRIAAGLGSDVPFFIRGGTALGQGKGDALEMLPLPLERHGIIMTVPETEDAAKTARMYGLLGPANFTDGARTERLARRIRAGESLKGGLFNAFESVASQAYRWYNDSLSVFAGFGGRIMLAGAGPSLFRLADEWLEASFTAGELSEAGSDAQAVRLIGPWSETGLEEMP